MPKTRKAVSCPVFRHPAAMNEIQLPTWSDVMKNYLLLRNQMRSGSDSAKEPTVSEIAESLALKVELIWKKASLPIISHNAIVNKIRRYHDSYRKLLKPYKGRKADVKYNAKISQFAASAKSELFDISSCRCSDYSLCKCKKEDKISTEERQFIADQRSLRHMAIGGIDLAATSKLQRALRRKMSADSYSVKQIKKTTLKSSVSDSESSDDTSTDTQDTEDWCPIPAVDPNLPACSKSAEESRSLDFPTVARVCDRYGVSDRCSAHIVLLPCKILD